MSFYRDYLSQKLFWDQVDSGKANRAVLSTY